MSHDFYGPHWGADCALFITLWIIGMILFGLLDEYITKRRNKK